MITAADQATLRRLVGPTTFARASAYARQGAVKSRQWGEGGRFVVGEVQGGAREPYRAAAELTRTPTRMLSGLHAVCTCPVAVNCKHAVALLLADDSALGGGVAGAVAKKSGWELSLAELVANEALRGREISDPQIGVQFELVASRPAAGREPTRIRPGVNGAPAAAGPGIRLRPVIRGRTGKWVRTGISWAKLDDFSFHSMNDPGDAVRLLKELLAMSRVTNRRTFYTYSYSEPEVWLDQINSRRLWDLLREAGDLELPLLASGRQAYPVTLSSSAAVVTLAVSRDGADLKLAPKVTVGDRPVELSRALLVGHPAHGLAWWDIDPASDTPKLSLAPLGAPLDDAVRALVGKPAITVPVSDEERFLRDFYPSLTQRLAVRSDDESVALPEVVPSALILTVTHREGHRIDLAWGIGDRSGSWAVPLRDASRQMLTAQPQASALQMAASLLDELSDLFEWGGGAPRLSGTAQLTGIAAVLFLAELLPELANVPGLVIDELGEAPQYREATESPVVRLSGTDSPTSDWFDLAVAVTVGGEEVPFEQLFVALAEEQSHLILPSGTYFSLERDELRQLAQLIAEARALHDAPGQGIRLSRFQASLWEDLCRLGVVTAQASAWEASVRALVEATDRAEYPTPPSLQATLRPYQEVGFNWLAFLYEHGLGGVLADDMGLGKTLQALALICHVKERHSSTFPFLVVAPTSVVQNWWAECRRFAPGLEVRAVSETHARRGSALAEMAAEADVVVTSYALFRLEYEHYQAIEWAGLFLDEAQFVKNRASQTYQRAKMLPVPFKVAMTGTPMENSLMELWSLLSITAPGLFARPDHFEEQYRTPIEKKGDGERLDQLRRRIRPLMLRRTKEQVVAELPEKQEQVLELELNPKHKKLYQTYLARERQKVLGLLGDMTKNRFEIFRSLTLLRQASLDISLVDPKHANVPSTKLDALMEMLDDIVADGHRVLVFSQFTRFLTEARDRIDLAGIDFCYLDGRTRKRAQVIREFQQGTAPVFLISLKAGGFGLNLAEADYCILLDPWWNPATEAQAVDRIHRIGQTRKVMVYRLVAKDTIEEKVMALKTKKAALFADVVDGGGFTSGALSAADIRGLLS